MYIHICLHCKVQFNNILNTFILTASGQRRHREVLAPLCLGEGHTVLSQSGGSCTSVTGTKPESEGLSLPAQLGKGGFNCNGNRCDQDFSYKPKDLMQQQLVSLTTILPSPYDILPQISFIYFRHHRLSILPEADHINLWSNLNKNKDFLF